MSGPWLSCSTLVVLSKWYEIFYVELTQLGCPIYVKFPGLPMQYIDFLECIFALIQQLICHGTQQIFHPSPHKHIFIRITLSKYLHKHVFTKVNAKVILQFCAL
jgi:hypothetical protein